MIRVVGGGTTFSATAEEVFFEHPELSVAEWEQQLMTGRIGDAVLDPDLVAELRLLVGELASLPGSDQPGPLAGRPDAPPRSLTVMGRDGCGYELQGRLGTGGHAIVYRGLQYAPFERVVAVKVYYAAATDLSSLDQIPELDALRRLHHPGLCGLIDAGITPWMQPFVVFEFVDGQPLHHHVADVQPSFAERLRLFDEVLEVVEYAHSQGVTHRDLKPHNILIHRSSGRVKLIDFSISRIQEPGTTAVATVTSGHSGTREYQSPEQAGLISARVDGRTDIFALGCVLFELFAEGRAFPWTDDDGTALSQAVIARRHAEQCIGLGQRLHTAMCECFPDVSAEQRNALESILGWCVATDPADRYESVRGLREDVAAAIAGQRVRLPAHATRGGRRRRQVAMAAAAVALLLVASGMAVRGRLWQPTGGEAAAARENVAATETLAAFQRAVAGGSDDAVLAATRALRALLSQATAGPRARPAASAVENAVASKNWASEATALLAVLAENPRRLVAADEKVATDTLLAGMRLANMTGAYATTLAFAEILEEPLAAQAEGEVLAEWTWLKAGALDMSRRPDEALATLMATLKQAGTLSRVERNKLLLSAATIHVENGRPEKALEMVQPQLASAMPTNRDEIYALHTANYLAGRALVMLEQFDEALGPLRRAMTIHNTSKRGVSPTKHLLASMWLGRACEGAGEPAEALGVYQAALADLQRDTASGLPSDKLTNEIGRFLRVQIAMLASERQASL